MKTRDIIAAIKAVQKAKTKLEKMNETYPRKYKEELEEVGKTVIAQWYATYEPVFYNRDRSLYHAFRVDLRGTDYSVDFDSAYLEHGSLSSLIFENSFMQGYHGGVSSGKGHPQPGMPYWRTPIPSFVDWGRPAIRSFSPYYRMVFEMNKKIKEIDKEKQEEFDKTINKVENALSKLY